MRYDLRLWYDVVYFRPNTEFKKKKRIDDDILFSIIPFRDLFNGLTLKLTLAFKAQTIRI